MGAIYDTQKTIPYFNQSFFIFNSNKIKQLNAIDFLSTCKQLNNLDLTNNMIANASDYRQRVKVTLPSLLILDGFGFDDSISNANIIAECSSSLTSDISKDSSSISDRMLDSNVTSRPMSGTSPFGDGMPSDALKRPSTAGAYLINIQFHFFSYLPS